MATNESDTPAGENAAEGVGDAVEPANTPAGVEAAADAKTENAKMEKSEKSEKTDSDTEKAKERRSRLSDSAVTLSMRSLLIGGLITALIAALVVFVIRDVSARSDLRSLETDQADRATAERIAGEYAVDAATLDYEDLTPWVSAMREGVSPELSRKYEVIGQAMEQILTPLRMKTTAELVTANTEDVAGDVYRVVAVVNVNTTTVQNPAGGSTVAVYTLVLDRAQDWLITDVGDPTQAITDNLGSGAGENPPPAPAPAPGPDPTPGPPAEPTPGG